MKKIFIITACLCATPAVATTVNFTGDCDSCVQFVSCMTKKIMPSLNCDIVNSASIYEEWASTYDETAAVNACVAAYPSFVNYYAVIDFAKNASFSYVKDKCNLDELNLAAGAKLYAETVMYECSGMGYCLCKDGYYIQPRGLEPGLWGVNSECKKCPTGGTADGAYSLGIESCYMPAGPFSDSTGQGSLTDTCRASFSSPEEEAQSWL